jgi:concanavalin A-like lectin/glucanase superfamily protein
LEIIRMKHEQHYSAPFALSSRGLHTFLRCIILVSSLGVLVSCGNSTEVESNTNNGGGGGGSAGPTYLGPAPLTNEVQKFKTEFWNPLAADNRCGQCHTSGGAAENFPFVDRLDINAAFAAATSTNNASQLIVDRSNPGNSRAVLRVAEGHNCWGSNSNIACADIVEGYINNWVSGTSKSGGRSITLTAPPISEPGKSRNFPTLAADSSPSFKTALYDPILTQYCAECHSDSSNTPQSPFFASADIKVAYAAAKSKINLDAVNVLADGSLEPLPLDSAEQSRFVTRVLELHNCWTADCAADADLMRLAIFSFSQGIALTEIDPALVTSKAMKFTDATLASGGNRYENDQIAIWEFKSGSGNQAFDTSGIEPAMTLTFNGPVNWILGYGIEFAQGGYANATPTTSKKLTDLISLNNAYSIEAWVIPANVTQENTRIISYTSGNGTTRNFSMSQTMYQYEYFNRSTNTGAEGTTSLLTLDTDEDLQAALQHVVITFDPVNGRRIYINGVFTDDVDPDGTQGGTLLDWDDSFAFVLGSEGTSTNTWGGKLRLVAVHNSALTQEQIAQNFSVGVGQKYFMMFSVGDLLGLNINEAFVVFQTELYDNTAYLFDKPIFINLDGTYVPNTDILLQGMRIGINGREAVTGQAFGNLDATINSTNYTIDGQPLSRLGTVIPVGKGPESDEFFLTFERIGSNVNTRVEADPVAPTILPEAAAVPLIGVKTFDEINASMSAITGISIANPAVAATFATYKQQLPAIEDIRTFLSSHQMGVAQLAMSYCNELIQADKVLAANDPARYFKNFDFSLTVLNAFSPAARNQIIEPLLVKSMNLDLVGAPVNNLATQPGETAIKDLLGSSATQTLDVSIANSDYESLITTMTQCALLPADVIVPTLPLCSAIDTVKRTEDVVIATCAATLGSAITIIQ